MPNSQIVFERSNPYSLRETPFLSGQTVRQDEPLEYFSQPPPPSPVRRSDSQRSCEIKRPILCEASTQTEELILFPQVISQNTERVVPITLQIGILPMPTPAQTQQPQMTSQPQPAPQPQPAGNGLLPPGMTTSGVLPLPPLNPAITNPTDADNWVSKSRLCRCWRSIDLMERSYICYGFALCAFVFAIVVLAVVPPVLNKKLTC